MTANIAAFFDIDKTILEVNSGSKWIGYQWKTGQMSPWQLARALGWLVQYRFGLLDFDAMSKKVLANYAGQPVAPISREIERWFHSDIAESICAEARERIAEHRQEGHVLVLLTSATRFLSAPVAQTLDVEHILCTEVEVEDGMLTGRYVHPACYGPGKVEWAERFAGEHSVDLDQSYFYSDSVSDLPMLERVGQPRVVNPDPRLRRKAIERGWPLETWSARTPGGEGTGHVGA